MKKYKLKKVKDGKTLRITPFEDIKFNIEEVEKNIDIVEFLTGWGNVNVISSKYNMIMLDRGNYFSFVNCVSFYVPGNKIVFVRLNNKYWASEAIAGEYDMEYDIECYDIKNRLERKYFDYVIKEFDVSKIMKIAKRDDKQREEERKKEEEKEIKQDKLEQYEQALKIIKQGKN